MTAPISSLLNNPLSKAFYSYFPTLRTEYTDTQSLSAAFKKIEAIAFGSFPSLRKTTGNEELIAERARIIDNIQASSIEGKTVAHWLRSAENKIASSKTKFLFAHEKREVELLERQHLALLYRSGALKKGYDRSAGEALAKQVEPVLRFYISHTKIFPGRHSHGEGEDLANLSAKEKERLVHACTRYPKLFEIILQKHEGRPGHFDGWTADFVKWSLRSGCSIGVFVKTPNEREFFSKIHLDKRSGSIDGNKGIRFCDVGMFGCFKRTLCIKMDDRMVPIQGDLKNRVITLNNLINPEAPGLTIRINEIFKSFKMKTSSYENVDYLQGGIRNWNAIRLGSYNSHTKTLDTVAADSVLRELKTKAPLTTLSANELEERYPLSEGIALENGQYALAIRASRQKPNLNVLEAHGYAEIVCREGDRYFIFPMGVQPIVLPQKALAKLFFITATHRAGLHYPDESFFLTQRQQIGFLYPLSEAETVRLHQAVSQMQNKADQGNLLFQFGGTNCSYHVQRLFDQVIGAPFFDKIQEIADRAFSRGNFLIEAIDRIQYRRAFEGLNHDLLHKILTKLIDHLWEEHNITELRELARLSQQLLSKAYQSDIPIDLEMISMTNPDCKKAVEALLFETIEAARPYRLDLFRSESDQGVLSSLNSLIKAAPWRWLKRVLINTVFFIFGSWRWAITRNEAPNRPMIPFEASTVAGNPLVQEGYLNHPAALWEWIKNKESRIVRISEVLRPLQRT
jgi:hypothetical protein